MHLAIIDNNSNLVVNVVATPAQGQTWNPPSGYTAVSTETGAIGDTYVGGVFVKPVVATPVPGAVTKRQFLIAAAADGMITTQEALAAAQTGAVPAAIDAVFASLPLDQRDLAKITWASMTIVERNDSLVAAVAVALNKTSEEIDALFTDAATI